MVLEFIYSTQRISRHPSIIFFEALILSVLAALLARFFFIPEHISFGILIFITIGFIPIFAKLFSYNSYLFNYSSNFFQRHKTIMLQLLYVFLGVFVAFTFIFFIVNTETREVMFSTQLSEIDKITHTRNTLTGQVSGTQIKKESNFSNAFNLIFSNNLGVVIRAGLLSLFYGAGAIYLIAWNASILATAIANDILVNLGGVVGVSGMLEGIGNALITLIGYIPHGLPEVLAYILISLAGAIFARALIKGLFFTEFRWVIIKDLILLVISAIALLLVGALIEASYFI